MHTETDRRVALAKSILNHREPTARTVSLALAALDGASVEELELMERAS